MSHRLISKSENNFPIPPLEKGGKGGFDRIIIRKPGISFLLILTILIGLTSFSASAESIYGYFKEGKEFYDKKNYKEALNTFLQAQVENSDDIRLKYNIANTQYKNKNYDEAIKGYLDVASKSKEDSLKPLKERAYYNTGNCFYRKEQLKDSAEYYKKALELDPNDKDARHNLELVLEKLKKQMDEQKKSGKDEKEKRKDENKKDENKNGKGKENNKGGEDSKNSAQQDREKNKQHQGDQQQREKDNEKLQDKGKSGMPAKQLSKEEAEMLLNSLKEDKKNPVIGDTIKKRMMPYNPSMDW